MFTDPFGFHICLLENLGRYLIPDHLNYKTDIF
jgi:hypothetical protein